MAKIIFLFGNICAGKTTLAKNMSRLGFIDIKIDDFYAVQKRTTDHKHWFRDEKYKEKTYNAFFDKIKMSIYSKKDIIVETTGVSRYFRKGYPAILSYAKKHHYDIYRVFIKVPISLAKERFRLRGSLKMQESTPLYSVDKISKKLNDGFLRFDHILNVRLSRKEIYETLKNIIKNS